MMRRLLYWLVTKLPRPRVIFDGEGRTPYLTRHYLFGRPVMPDGSEPFDQFGDMRPGAIFPARSWQKVIGGIYLHRFHRSDSDRELHSHPWRWALSLILVGGYREERRRGLKVVSRDVKAGQFNYIRHSDRHRVDLLAPDGWSLIVVGPKVSSWGFWSRETLEETPWREFLARKRAHAAIPTELEPRDD